ncbi:MAG: trypsin-like peptidase domain-containing protein [Chloroflexi bacterium]|nr:trypsin-like peptidase domain-containing protein [Chloroflexota bacterium]
MTTLLPQLNFDLGELADRVRKSLVQVTVERSGAGSGVVFAGDGLVVTNAHVVSGNRRRPPGSGLRVTLPDGAVTAAELLAKDDDLDVALLKIGPGEGKLPELHPIEMGDSRALRPGQWVMAMGHPWGVAGAAAGGIVIGAGPDLPEAPGAAKDWIAVDLALRPGHSGGPLVDHRGRLIGISTMMAGLEVGMAVPVHVIEEFVARVLAAGDAAAAEDDTVLV